MAIEKLYCLRCGHEWYPTSERLPLVCPKCKSYAWNDERKEQGEVKNEL